MKKLFTNDLVVLGITVVALILAAVSLNASLNELVKTEE